MNVKNTDEADKLYELFEEMDFINCLDHISNNKSPEYYFYVDESGEKRFELNVSGNYTIKKFNDKDTKNFGFYVWGGIISKSELQLDALKLEEELKSSELKTNFIGVLQLDITTQILDIFDDGIYMSFYINDTLLYIFEEWILDISSPIAIKSALEYEMFKNICLKFLKDKSVHAVKAIVQEETSTELLTEFYSWLDKHEAQNLSEKILKTKILANKITELDAQKFYFDYMGITLHQLWMFKNSKIEYDNDSRLEKIIKKSKYYKNVTFTDSKSSLEIQVSDFMIGLCRRFIEYLELYTEEELMNKILGMEIKVLSNFLELMRVLSNSVIENKLFFGSFISYETRQKYLNLIMNQYFEED